MSTLNKLASSLVVDKDNILGFIVGNQLPKKPKTQLEKRYDAFTGIYLDWVDANETIGTGIMEGLCLVGYYYKDLLENTDEALVREKQDALSNALDYFEGLLGNSFRLVN